MTGTYDQSCRKAGQSPNSHPLLKVLIVIKAPTDHAVTNRSVFWFLNSAAFGVRRMSSSYWNAQHFEDLDLRSRDDQLNDNVSFWRRCKRN